jgi:hypothetical protein
MEGIYEGRTLKDMLELEDITGDGGTFTALDPVTRHLQ